MCILLNVKKHEKTFALNVDIFRGAEQIQMRELKRISSRLKKPMTVMLR